MKFVALLFSIYLLIAVVMHQKYLFCRIYCKAEFLNVATIFIFFFDIHEATSKHTIYIPDLLNLYDYHLINTHILEILNM